MADIHVSNWYALTGEFTGFRVKIIIHGSPLKYLITLVSLALANIVLIISTLLPPSTFGILVIIYVPLLLIVIGGIIINLFIAKTFHFKIDENGISSSLDQCAFSNIKDVQIVRSWDEKLFNLFSAVITKKIPDHASIVNPSGDQIIVPALNAENLSALKASLPSGTILR